MHLTQPPGYRLQRGITLIESLVAILVMAIGILGILGLQMRTLTDTQAGVRRAQAIRLIEDLGERLQNNPDALGNLSAYTATPTGSDDCASTACAPDKLATYDIKQWRTSVSNALPGSQTTVFIPQGGPRQLGVLIGWSENRFNQNGQDYTATDKTALAAPLTVSATNAGGAAVNCPADLTCHLQYIQPTQRCTPWSLGSGALYCPN
ncbi:MAG: type IV pilus modification protein PilV [Proteobacteria bacterium]|nr:type IV pilus modification protein PilV [Pseudomonadota bacterium]